MRTAQKRDILELIGTLHQAQDEIKKNIESKNYAFAQDMLGQCQNCAISIGEAVENSEGEEFVTLSYIEDYCDILYHVYEEINDSEDINANKVYKTLRKHLLKFENSIRNDVLAKKEMVFFPYKASMWDSLESVWRAADKDPECDAYVVPIPYYDRNPDGRFGREHYEGSAFPHDVPIVHYKKYDVSKRHPDAIFIHNPYDNNNYVTSVHPNYYSEKLKKCCEKLIYIPYYVSEETNSDAPEIMKAKTGFVLSGGVLNSDMVIVQSENTKRLYINILEKHFPNVSHSYWEQKIQGLGSPKLDRVVRIQRDDEKLPGKWREVIYTKKGERKKTILYNISLATLLENGDILEKIKDVFDFFKNRKDVALWWRPHPLYESTIASMRPGLLKEYREITEKYIAEAWGIFDEGVDLEWAIAETDAYYGDRSSVVRLYKEAGKPVMIQNVYVRTKQEIMAEEIPIWPSAFCVDGDDIWFVHGKMNVLMRYNMQDRYTDFIGTVQEETIFQGSSYAGIYKWGNKVFMIPAWAREIVIFSIEKQKFYSVPLKNVEKYERKILFCTVYANGKNLYCIPCSYESILKIDMVSCNIQYIDVNKILAKQGDELSKTYINDVTKINSELVAVLAYTNQILIFDMETEKIYIKKIGMERQFTNVSNIGDTLYLLDKPNKTIIASDYNIFDEKEKYPIMCEGTKMISVPSGAIIFDSIDSTKIQIRKEEGVITFDGGTKTKVPRFGLYNDSFYGVESSNHTDGKFYYFCMYDYAVYQIYQGEVIERFSMVLRNAELERLEEAVRGTKDTGIFENELYNLKLWIDKLKEMNFNGIKLKCGCGEKILNRIKKELFCG